MRSAQTDSALPPSEIRATTIGPDKLDCDEFRHFMSHWPTGVMVVTSRDRDTPVGCTVNAVMSASLAPPLLVVALAKASSTLGAIMRTGAFGLNVLASHQRELCERFARGGQNERFRDLGYRLQSRVPLLCDVIAATICTVHNTTPCGDHLLVVGAPVWLTMSAEGSPLVFHRHAYHGLVDAAGEAVC